VLHALPDALELGPEGEVFVAENPVLRGLPHEGEVVDERGDGDRRGDAQADGPVAQKSLVELKAPDRRVMVRNDDQRDCLLPQVGSAPSAAVGYTPGHQASHIPACLILPHLEGARASTVDLTVSRN
jgi:hypothetical protein